LKHEIHLQFELAEKLKQRGIPFVLEMSLPVGRVDIAITDGCNLYAIIECKRRRQSVQTFQIVRYQSIGVPVHLATFETDTNELVTNIETEYRCGTGFCVAVKGMKDREGLLKKWRRPRSRMAKLRLELDEDLNWRN
jgi:hypothetical protein